MEEKYSVYSKFDIEMHKKTFVHYLEVVIDEDGQIMYAVPSHQEKLIKLACVKLNIERRELLDRCPPEYYGDFMVWLCMVSGCVSVWDEFLIAHDINQKQTIALKKLKIHGLYHGPMTAKRKY